MQFIHPHAPIERGRGDGKVRLTHQCKKPRCALERGEYLAPAFGQRGTAADAVGHVAADCCTDALQYFIRHLRAKHRAQGAQRRRGIGAAACHAGAGGDPLGDVNFQRARRDAALRKERQRGLDGQIVFILRQTRAAMAADALLLCKADGHVVVQCNTLHHHAKVMIAVRALAQDVQRQIQLGIGR